jgi:hypothetical protein
MEIIMKFILNICFIFILNILTSQSVFFKSYGGEGNDFGEEVIESNDSGFVAIGGTESFGNGLMDLYLFKIDSIGDIIWTKTFGGPNIDYGNDVIETNDNGYIACGYSNSVGLDYNIFIVKVNSEGVHQWTKNIGGNNWDFAYSIAQSFLDPSEYYIVGETYSYGQGNGDAFVLKMNNNGDTLWMKTFGGQENDFFNEVIEDNTGNVYCIGATKSQSATENLWIAKLDTGGQLQWNYYHYDSINSIGNSITVLGNNNEKINFCGEIYQNDSISINKTFLIGGISNTGNYNFTAGYPNNFSKYEKACVKVMQKPNTNRYFVVSNYHQNNDNKIFYAELADQWQQPNTSRIKGNGNDFVHGGDFLSSGNGFIISGTTEETLNGQSDVFLSRTDNGLWDQNYSNTSILGINKSEKIKIEIFPNPCFNEINIKNINSNTHFEIKDMYNNTVLTGSITQDPINVEKLSCGVYFFSIEKENKYQKFIKL